MPPERGDVILIPIPFTDLSSRKRRPVIVVSSTEYNRRSQDVVVVAMTSSPTPAPFNFQITSADMVRGRLNRPATVRADKIYTLHQGLIVTTFGRVNLRTVSRIRRLLQDLTSSRPTSLQV
jgi:mRNA interferase MazF